MKQQAERYLGDEIEPQEYLEAKASAERKLDWIISREGDADGERRKPYYIAQLIAEAVRSSRFSLYCFIRCELARCAEKNGTKKEQPAL